MMVLWLRFLTEINEQTKEIPAEMMENEYISKAVGIVEQSAYTDAQRMAYDKFWDEIVSERTLMKGYFRQGHAEGRAEGLAEGRAEGLAEGEKKGRAEGMKEGEEKGRKDATLANALSLKKNGVPVDVIANSLGLSIDDVRKL